MNTIRVNSIEKMRYSKYRIPGCTMIYSSIKKKEHILTREMYRHDLGPQHAHGNHSANHIHHNDYNALQLALNKLALRDSRFALFDDITY